MTDSNDDPAESDKTARVKWSKTRAIMGLPHLPFHTVSFQLLNFMLTCPGTNPALNLALAGVPPWFLLRGEVRYQAAMVFKQMPDGYIFSLKDAQIWVSRLNAVLLQG
jgi:hypothetical protein